MNTVARAVNVAARNALVRLHEVESGAPPCCTRRAGKGPGAPPLAEVEGVDPQQAASAPAAFISADQGHLGAGAFQRRQCAREETFGATERAEPLAHDREPQPHAALARISRAAACTASTGKNVRPSLPLLPPQPSTRHGRQECVVVTMRCSTFQGAHSSSLEGPKSATVGVPMAAARCIGIESTPMKSCARAVSAPSSLRESLPVRLSGLLAVLERISSMKAVSDGAPVSTTACPSAARRSASCALRSAGQHLNVQREAGCM